MNSYHNHRHHTRFTVVFAIITALVSLAFAVPAWLFRGPLETSDVMLLGFISFIFGFAAMCVAVEGDEFFSV